MGRLEGRRGHARVAVLTVIDQEFNAVRAALGADHEVGQSGVYSPVHCPGSTVGVPFVLAQSSSRSNTPASHTTGKLVEWFRPEVVLLVGIAGGVVRPYVADGSVRWKGPGLGDVVVAEYVHYADFVKNVPMGRLLRYFPFDQPAAGLVTGHARAVYRTIAGVQPWHAGLGQRPVPGQPAVHVGEVVAVEGVAGNPDSEQQRSILERFDNAAAVDMESMGVGRALHDARSDVHYNPTWMCVRGISDLVRTHGTGFNDAQQRLVTDAVSADNNQERSLWKPYAAASAAAYTRRLLERLLARPRSASPADDGAGHWDPLGTADAGLSYPLGMMPQ